MKKIRFLSALLTFCMVFGAIAQLSVIPVFATNDVVVEGETGEESTEINYITKRYYEAEEKLADMKLMVSNNSFELYYESKTGEVAVKNIVTGETLFTNPYDVAVGNQETGKVPAESTKNKLLSQILLSYNDIATGNVDMVSFVEAAMRDQIKMKYIKNGIRVEYIIGRQEDRKLVPRLIEKERFETLILPYITDKAKYTKVINFYDIQDVNDPYLPEAAKKEIIAQYPMAAEMVLYSIDPTSTERELNVIESIIKEFCPHYTYEILAEDHDMTQYQGNDKAPPVFRMALEYTLDETGVTVRMPANSISYDEDTYSINYIEILPYMGAGSSEYTGYVMIPDGSGALVRFEDTLKLQTMSTISGKLYGPDYAYHNIGSQNQQVMRMPVFGMVENYTTSETVYEYDENGLPIYETAQTVEKTVGNGYVAIIEEGDALATIKTEHGANTIHKYNSVFVRFTPRESDSYNLGSSMSVGGNTTYSVTSSRRYTGSFKIKYMLLTDKNVATEKDVEDYYETSYVGMAKGYRDYLENKGYITPIENDGADIPLYIETLGAIDVQEKVMTIPVMVKKPLTTFDDMKTMAAELNEAGITNIIYRLTGFTNGGLKFTVPYKVEYEDALGGNDGYKDFLSYSKENGIQVFTDFELSYALTDEWFDGFSYKDDAVKTIDKRYTQKRVYSPALQYYEKTGEIAISPSVFEKIFGSLSESVKDLGVDGISVGTLGSDLNSDFDENEPYNREDSKEFVQDTLTKIRDTYGKVMIEAGNSYAIPYATHVLNVSLDSSNYTYASESIPLFGLVYHSYVNFSGKPINMAGDIRQEKLKMLENGANPYFILAYQNESLLKNDPNYSSYYSVSYSIWKDDLISIYTELNDVLKLVKSSAIVDHEFIVANRVITPEEQAEIDEKLAEIEARKAAILAEQQAEIERAMKYAERKGIPYVAPTFDEIEIEDEIDYSRYISDNGMVVRVTYENGIQFILNYNMFDVTVDGNVISGLGYTVIKPQ